MLYKAQELQAMGNIGVTTEGDNNFDQNSG